MKIAGGRQFDVRVAAILGAVSFAIGVAAVHALAFTFPDAPKTILDLQPFRQSESIRITSGAGREGVATLVNLNPAINAWYVLTITWRDGTSASTYHLENPKPRTRKLVLDQRHPSGILIEEDAGRVSCNLFADPSADSLEQGRKSREVYYPLCDARIYLRNPGVGHRTGLEAATEFLRDRVWGGEAVIGFGHQVMSDANRETGLVQTDAGTATAARAHTSGPEPALIDPAFADRVIVASSLGIGVSGAPDGKMTPGAWYATGTPGSFVSVFQPNFIAPQILQGGKSVNALDSIESSALCYLIAFDLDRFRLGYARGTAHPALGWSDHIPVRMKNPQMPGPDGIGDSGPLAATGLVAPFDLRRTAATFTAGFKRFHGAFLHGDLSLVNNSTHYGFIENGVVFSRLQPGLSTIIVRDDDTVDMKTWEEKDNALLPRIRFARQNGVPLVELDSASQTSRPGSLVTQWGEGNWSGSQDRKLRTMRSGAGLYSSGGKRYLIYAVFSSATPSAMVRVFQAYRCQHAMLLDMNALEHTYLAFYRTNGTQRTVEYLMRGMCQVDTNLAAAGSSKVRFIGYPDNRDFFYVMRREKERRSP